MISRGFCLLAERDSSLALCIIHISLLESVQIVQIRKNIGVDVYPPYHLPLTNK
jgi:hypothetical protein